MPIPVFRIASAACILWLIQPEIVHAPLRGLSASLQDLLGERQDPVALLKDMCRGKQETCAALALELMKQQANDARATGALPKATKP